ncbi:transposase [Bradyrhizobium sp. B124]|uniref:transposase n=1 Tax=Bradyrhizobium sp. B124 TaxID=3140245 RepID=UPI003183F86B
MPVTVERGINGQSPERRRTTCRELSAPLVADFETWMREWRVNLSRRNDLAKPMDYLLTRWNGSPPP